MKCKTNSRLCLVRPQTHVSYKNSSTEAYRWKVICSENFCSNLTKFTLNFLPLLFVIFVPKMLKYRAKIVVLKKYAFYLIKFADKLRKWESFEGTSHWSALVQESLCYLFLDLKNDAINYMHPLIFRTHGYISIIAPSQCEQQISPHHIND